VVRLPVYIYSLTYSKVRGPRRVSRTRTN